MFPTICFVIERKKWQHIYIPIWMQKQIQKTCKVSEKNVLWVPAKPWQMQQDCEGYNSCKGTQNNNCKANSTSENQNQQCLLWYLHFKLPLVSVTGHYLPIFVTNACHNHTCVNLCSSFLSQLEPVLHQPCQSHQLDTKLHHWAQWLPADWRHLVHCMGLTPHVQILHGV